MRNDRPDEKKYPLQLIIDELYLLRQFLTTPRKQIDLDYQSFHFIQKTEPLESPLIVSACKRQKIAEVENPDSTVDLQDYLDHASHGKSN